jgi:enterochelin esterase-like enzyme
MNFSLRRQRPAVSVEQFRLQSRLLGREVRARVYLPPLHLAHEPLPLLLFNDGQDLEALGLEATLNRLYESRAIRRLLVVGLPAGERIQEYGTACCADYQGRGARALPYARFIAEELMPYVQWSYSLLHSPGSHAFAGFSLGGLSAFDIAWNHPQLFGIAGVFSGALWWRIRDYEAGYLEDHDRIIHNVVRYTLPRRDFRAWFEAGTEDETEDRNQNGVIDAIDDTLDLMALMKAKGCQDIRYLEIEGGRHDLATWAGALPDFLTWAFPA